MKEISFDEFLKIWREKLSETWDNEIFSVYVANPFCAKKCKFCLYRSTVVTDDLYQQYYDSYLPYVIGQLSELLDTRIPDTFYFGGGTASLMTDTTMRRIFDALPNLQLSKSKSFEANPTSITKEKIDILASYGFTELSLGVQTFCEETLRKQDRDSVAIADLSELVDYATSHGVYVNVDLLTYYESTSPDNITRLSADLEIIKRYVNPGKITVYPKYETYWRSSRDEQILQIKNLRNAIKSFCDESGYIANRDLLSTDNDQEILSFGILDYHIYNTHCSLNAPHLRYNCSGPGYICNHQNTIGIGGYGNQIPYSYIWGRRQWHMVNDNWITRIFEDDFNSTDSPERYL